LQAARHLLNQNAVIQLGVPVDVPAPANQSGLTFQEVQALATAVAPSSLSHWGWKVEGTGRVTTETGQIVFRAGFASALKKIVEGYSG
jgi:hypothetical protein